MSLSTTGHGGRILATGLTATGTNQATALPLPGRADLVAECTTVAASTGVLLPPINLPMRVEVVNQGANALSVYPQLGGTIDLGSVNASTSIGVGKAAIYEASSLGNWYTVSTTAALGGSGSGSVTSTSVATANGFSGTVANPTTTPAITIQTTVTGLLKGNGTATSAATAGTDYVIPSGNITGSAASLSTAIADKSVIGNISGGSAAPTAVTVTALIDEALGNTQGDVLYRGAANWGVLAPGSSGQFLQTQGASANPQWASASGSGTVNSGTSGNVAYYGSTGTAVSGETLTSLIDAAIGNTQGDVLYRGAANWGVLAPGSSGQFLQTQGASANPQWASASGSGTVNSGTSGNVAYYGGTGTAVSGEALTSLIDAAIGNTQGDLLYRGASSWGVLAPGATGQVLLTGGASANPSWATTFLQLDAFQGAITTDAESTGTATCNLATSNAHLIVLNANVTVALSNAGATQKFSIIFQQAASGGPFSITSFFSGTIHWMGGSFAAPTMPTTASAYLVCVFWQISSGVYLAWSLGGSAS